MTADLTAPIAHDARHDVDLVIENPTELFCTARFAAFGLTEAEVRQLWEQLGEWLQTK